MLHSSRITSVLAGVLLAATAFAQAPAAAPAGSTGLCRDGSYWSGATKRGACHGHKGVQDWYGSAEAPASSGAATTKGTPAVPAATTATPAAPSTKADVPAATPAVGGGPGQVWVNSSSKVYHCPSDRWYGKTKKGVYMSESDAVSKGNRPDHGKACK